jgi:hypothetical protein
VSACPAIRVKADIDAEYDMTGVELGELPASAYESAQTVHEIASLSTLTAG